MPSHSATSPRQEGGRQTALGADDRDRTGDLNLGKVALYQLSYVRRRAEATTANSEQLCAGRAEATNPPRTHRQFIDDRELLGNDGDHDKLSDPIATDNGKRLLPQVDQNDLHLPAISGVDEPGAVDHGDAVAGRQPAAGNDQTGEALGYGNGDAGRNRRSSAPVECGIYSRV